MAATRVVTTSLVLCTAAACLDDSITGVRELAVEVTVTATALSVGDTLNVTIAAEGNGLTRAILDFGDDSADTILAGSTTEIEPSRYGVPDTNDTITYAGPLGVAGDRRHVYTVPGSYVLVGTALGAAGVVADSVTVTVN